jgi:HK97 family phage portal protein
MAKENFFDKVLKVFGLIRKSNSQGLPLITKYSNFSFFDEGKISKSKLLENNTNWVFACVKARAEAVGNIQLRLFETKKDGTVVEIYEHELLDLIASVNPFMAQFELFELLETHLSLTGNAYWFLDGVNSYKDKPIAIYPLNPKYIEIKKGVLPNVIEKYRYNIGEFSREFEPYEILHFRETNPDDYFEGRGILESIADWVDADNFATQWNKMFFLNSARPDSILEHEANLTPEQIEFLRASFEEVYRGINKAHKTLILPKGTKFSQVGFSQKEMDFVEMQRMMRDKILAAFRVPKTILGLTEDVNRANAEASNYVFALRVIKPQMERIVGYLNEFLVPRYGENLFLDFVDPVPENKELEITEYEKALNGQAYASINEIREKQGLPPIENGDNVMINPSLVPLGTPIEKSIKTNIKNKKRPAVRFLNNLKRRKNIAELVAKEARKVLEKDIEKILSELDDEKWGVIWKAFVVRVTPYEKKIIETLKKFNKEQKEKVINKLKKETKQIGDLFDKEEEISILIDFVDPILRELFEKEGKEALKLIGSNMLFSIDSERISKQLEKSIKLMSKSYNETTLDLLKEKLKEGFEAGESFEELKNRIIQIYEWSDEFRAERVARTETFRIANEATREAWKQSGVVKSFKWFTALDERVCEFCGKLNGKIVGVDEKWFKKGDVMTGSEGGKLDIDYVDIEHPPLHVNCRCYIRPEEISID